MKHKIYSFSSEGIREFLDNPLWLSITLLGYLENEEIKTINKNSVATAKLSFIVASIGGAKDKGNLEEYLPFKVDKSSQSINLSQQTIDIFWELFGKDCPIPSYVFKAFNNKDLMPTLKAGKRS